MVIKKQKIMRYKKTVRLILILSSTYKCNFLGADNKQ